MPRPDISSAVYTAMNGSCGRDPAIFVRFSRPDGCAREETTLLEVEGGTRDGHELSGTRRRCLCIGLTAAKEEKSGSGVGRLARSDARCYHKQPFSRRYVVTDEWYARATGRGLSGDVRSLAHPRCRRRARYAGWNALQNSNPRELLRSLAEAAVLRRSIADDYDCRISVRPIREQRKLTKYV